VSQCMSDIIFERVHLTRINARASKTEPAPAMT
jgi:hypothetical protein